MQNKNIQRIGANRSRRWQVIFGVAILILLILLALFITHSLPINKAKKTPVTASSNTKGEPISNSSHSGTNAGSDSPQTTSPQQSNQKSSAGNSTSLLAPSGDFISNHHPNLGGSPAPNTITSVCNSTPGASCKITFSKDGVVKSLPAQTIDSGGGTYWTNWKLQDTGLTEGSWHVEAIASLNGQTKSSSDALLLVVNP